ncbi:hypothetical protein F5141DRAFT_1217745 [Pisolithus sp. B1]|nr:hypothetical protein F5141DRAFT_1217745 [Pisolithus sp. B1]
MARRVDRCSAAQVKPATGVAVRREGADGGPDEELDGVEAMVAGVKSQGDKALKYIRGLLG